MVHKEPSERKKRKPRGRPFAKGNKRGKPENNVLVTSGHESSDEGGIVTQLKQSVATESLKESYDKMEAQQKEDLQAILHPQESQSEELPAQAPVENVVIESLEFKKGKDTLKIALYKKHNRMFRVQIFLNETTEIRPVTYTGANTAFGYWNLLKKSLQGDA